ncbi:MAG: hypothetical protein CBB97_24865 [Candidatus Endolissoclinum sp. TMED37]|nr:MAG: hypothetical protein CBB97_24865 [Candidatus Endolissoclinum sp. TMED37]
MKVLIISVRGPTNKNRRGGAQDYIRFIASPWLDQGYEVAILCAQEHIAEQTLPSQECVDGIMVTRVEAPHSRLFSLLRATVTTMGNYDVVVENMMGFPLFLPIIVRGRPLVALKHHFEGLLFLRSQGLVKGFVGIVLENILQPLVYRRVPFVVVSKATSKILSSRWLRPRAGVHIVPPGVKTVGPSSRTRQAGCPTIIYYGALDIGRKRLDHLIEAFRYVSEKLPTARLIIGGTGPDEAILRSAADDLNVEFVGFLSESQKVELLALGWVFASPSMTEGFGITWVEANSAGIPVVAYELGLDTLNDSCSMRVPVGDVPALANAIYRLLVDEALREAMREPCLINAARFDWQQSSDCFLRVINSVVDCSLPQNR